MPQLLALSPTDSRVIDLMNAQQKELRELYNDTDERTEPFDPSTLSGEGCALLGIEENQQLLACGALKRLNNEQAEIKRMYTSPKARGRGFGRQILNGIIKCGRIEKYQQIVLETGDLQAEAIALYESVGFKRIPNFGYYVGIENSWCYGLKL